ncbi:MAG: magnesium transporter CorA [Saccharofermentans sp.]|nr:magnesium transporter CorA [Saccharofermentans sp.]
MKCFEIAEKMKEVQISDFKSCPFQYVVILTPSEWVQKRDLFDMGIDLDVETSSIYNTRAEVNYDSLTGEFYIPDRNNLSGNGYRFAFALDEKGVIFIDDNDDALTLVTNVAMKRKLINPCLERFLYDFLELIIDKDQQLLEQYDHSLDKVENTILDGETDDILSKISGIRSDLRDLKTHYTQLLDLCQELEENENDFFKEENERYFHLVCQRIETLYDIDTSLVDFSIQIRDFYQTQMDVKQNNTIALLTIISTIFMPLTLIAGWYGMNFRYMPELNWPWAYPAVFLVSVVIVIACVLIFKKKKWL